jgi:hypothetical protein
LCVQRFDQSSLELARRKSLKALWAALSDAGLNTSERVGGFGVGTVLDGARRATLAATSLLGRGNFVRTSFLEQMFDSLNLLFEFRQSGSGSARCNGLLELSNQLLLLLSQTLNLRLGLTLLDMKNILDSADLLFDSGNLCWRSTRRFEISQLGLQSLCLGFQSRHRRLCSYRGCLLVNLPLHFRKLGLDLLNIFRSSTRGNSSLEFGLQSSLLLDQLGNRGSRSLLGGRGCFQRTTTGDNQLLILGNQSLNRLNHCLLSRRASLSMESLHGL